MGESRAKSGVERKDRVQSVSTLKNTLSPTGLKDQRSSETKDNVAGTRDGATRRTSGSGVYKLALPSEPAAGVVEICRFRKGEDLCTVRDSPQRARPSRES